MKITRHEVEHVARLAKLELQQEEIERMTAQLDDILGYAAKLNELDTEGVSSVSTHSRRAGNAFRDDQVRDSLTREQTLANGPDHDGESFVVPRIIR